MIGQRFEKAVTDCIDRTLCGYPDKMWRACFTRSHESRVMVDQGRGVLIMDFEPPCRRLRAIVGPLHQLFAGQVILARNLWRMEQRVVSAA
jgi:hypothetical protein